MVKSVLRVVYLEVKGLHQAAYVLGLFAFSSQLLALLRDRLLAHQFGASAELDIYYAAFRIPDLLYVLFASTLSVYVLIPFVAERIKGTSTEKAQQLLSQVASLFLVSYSVLAAIIWYFAPSIVPFIAPGLVDSSDQIVLLLRILLLQPLLLGISSLFGVVTQIGHRFVLYALSPLVYNLGIIFGIGVLYPMVGLAGLTYGVVLGALGHMLLQWPLVRSSDLSFGLTTTFSWSTMWEVCKVSIPRATTLALHQVVLLALVAIASVMTVGSVAVFQFAYNLQSVPLAIIGASYSIAAFPLLADLFVKQKFDRFRSHILIALRHIIFWSVPVVVLVIVLRAQLVRVVLGSGAFDWNDTRLTAAVLAVLCISLVAQAVNLLIIRAFYAGGHTRGPLVVATIAAIATISSTYGLYVTGAMNAPIFQYVLEVLRVDDVMGGEVLLIALTYSAFTLLQAAWLLLWAARTYQLPLSWLPLHVGRSVAAALCGGFCAYATINFVALGINPQSLVGILIQGFFGLLFGVGGVIAAYYLVRSPELHEIAHSFKTKILKTDVLVSQDDVL